jgi:hypothetical protein
VPAVTAFACRSFAILHLDVKLALLLLVFMGVMRQLVLVMNVQLTQTVMTMTPVMAARLALEAFVNLEILSIVTTVSFVMALKLVMT